MAVLLINHLIKYALFHFLSTTNFVRNCGFFNLTLNKLAFIFILLDIATLLNTLSNTSDQISCQAFMLNWVQCDNIINLLHDITLFIDAENMDGKKIQSAKYVAEKMIEEAENIKLNEEAN